MAEPTLPPVSPRVSLTVILGNEEHIVTRFLDSFAPVIDELCVVMSPGAVEPDQTEALVREWCGKHGVGLHLSHYRNREDWPHIDHFGQARQQAHELATLDWVMWADADDLYEGTRASLHELLDKADAAGAEGLSLVYDVRNMRRAFPRERLWRRGKMRWRNAVHEQLTHDDSLRMWICTGPQHPRIVHAPEGSKASSRDRNLRILDRTIEEGTPAYFYRAWDLQLSGKTDDAIAEYRRALSVDENELRRFAAFLALASIDKHDPALDAAYEALRLFPHRREGYGHAATLLLRRGQAQPALALLMAAASLPRQTVPDWTEEPHWYSPYLDELIASCHRILGNRDHADRLDNDRFARAGEKVTVIIPCAKAEAVHLREIWLAHASDRAGVEVLLVAPEGRRRACGWLPLIGILSASQTTACALFWQPGAVW